MEKLLSSKNPFNSNPLLKPGKQYWHRLNVDNTNGYDYHPTYLFVKKYGEIPKRFLVTVYPTFLLYLLLNVKSLQHCSQENPKSVYHLTKGAPRQSKSNTLRQRSKTTKYTGFFRTSLTLSLHSGCVLAWHLNGHHYRTKLNARLPEYNLRRCLPVLLLQRLPW